MRSHSRAGLMAVTAVTMATATFAIIAFSVLASQLIEEFEISRAQLGSLVTASALVGALASPGLGRLTDRVGAVGAMVGALVVGGVSLLLLALSPVFAVLIAGALMNGISNGWGNPATNALIVDNVSAGDRGIVTGVKQSGVQVGTFLGGLLLPVFAGWWNWRVALMIFLAMPVTGLIGMIGRRQVNTRAERAAIPRDGRVPTTVRWVATYGFISGLATSAMVGFIPLFAIETFGWAETSAGLLIALAGLAGIAARIYWPRRAEKHNSHGSVLRTLALMGVGTTVLLWAAGIGLLPDWVLIPASVLLGGGAVAWNAVGMLSVMDFSPSELVGKGTGVVLLGFLLGLAFGPLAMGYSVDQTGVFTVGWVVAGVLLLLSTVVASRISASETVSP